MLFLYKIISLHYEYEKMNERESYRELEEQGKETPGMLRVKRGTGHSLMGLLWVRSRTYGAAQVRKRESTERSQKRKQSETQNG